MTHEGPAGELVEKAAQAAALAPTEFRCCDYGTDGTDLTEEDMELHDMEPMIEETLHALARHAVPVNGERATPEIMREFAQMVRAKASRYEEFASKLDEIAAMTE